jgi:hypothetical protein
MSIVPPVAVSVVGIVLILVVVLALAAIAYTLITRDNPRQLEVDAEREQAAEQFGMSEKPDFEAPFKPPPEP